MVSFIHKSIICLSGKEFLMDYISVKLSSLLPHLALYSLTLDAKIIFRYRSTEFQRTANEIKINYYFYFITIKFHS